MKAPFFLLEHLCNHDHLYNLHSNEIPTAGFLSNQ